MEKDPELKCSLSDQLADNWQQTSLQKLINEYFAGRLRGPFNGPARLAAELKRMS